MKRLMIVTLAIFVLLSLSLAYAQHGKAPATAGQGMSHKPMNAGKPATTGKAAAGTKTPTELLDKNTKLAGKLQSLLPAGMTAQDACSGFRNLGQCVAAVHVSHNLGLTFTDLKTKMLGSTDPNAQAAPMSLGKAIQALDPKADSKAEVNKATKQAHDDMKTSG